MTRNIIYGKQMCSTRKYYIKRGKVFHHMEGHNSQDKKLSDWNVHFTPNKISENGCQKLSNWNKLLSGIEKLTLREAFPVDQLSDNVLELPLKVKKVEITNRQTDKVLWISINIFVCLSMFINGQESSINIKTLLATDSTGLYRN